jgi:hypothetical protein
VACPVSVQEQLRGWRCGSFFLGRLACVISRVGLTEGRKAHISRRGGVLSSGTPTASGMVLQCPGWRRGSGDGRTGPMRMEETRLTGPTSRCCPGRARDGARAVQEWVAQCHGADAGLTAQCRTVARMASPGGLAEQRRDMIPRRVRGTTWHGFVFDSGACMCQNIKCSGRGSRCGSGEYMGALSEAESRSRGCLALE